ncbi:hypothetical protein N657DRAFT_331855 [Parathielavia appendiculata]|uniref:Uncharacterized protein n=1 Tax=Parathielavia appendiculata TaxID=2587402 RepID=A0AAN6U1M0_9PEZI|nr:hypothetical protein N657DRAFT_331855 [Parathielavia appendiculata]
MSPLLDLSLSAPAASGILSPGNRPILLLSCVRLRVHIHVVRMDPDTMPRWRLAVAGSMQHHSIAQDSIVVSSKTSERTPPLLKLPIEGGLNVLSSNTTQVRRGPSSPSSDTTHCT